MSDEAKKVLQKLTDELGHITLIADWAERQKKALDDGTFDSAPAEAVAPVPLAAPEVPPAPALADKPATEAGNGQADLSGAPTPAANNGEQPASEVVGNAPAAPAAVPAAPEGAAAPSDAPAGNAVAASTVAQPSTDTAGQTSAGYETAAA